MFNRRTALLAIGAGVLAAPRAVFAHHGFSGRYDDAKPIYVEGEVISASFRRPHPIIEMRVAPELQAPKALPAGEEFLRAVQVRPEDRGRVVDVEYPPVRIFFDLGGRIGPGDRIATIVYQNCRPPHQLRGQWIRLSNGETVVRRGTTQTEEAGCLD